MTTDNTNSPPAVLILSVGPVQDFIATARRTQDLWMGSYILSHLTVAAMKPVTQGRDYKQAILFPTLEHQPLIEALWDRKSVDLRLLRLATLPNKFIARVESLDDGRRRAEQAQQAVYDAWNDLAQAVEAKFPGDLKDLGQAWRELWHEQNDPSRWIEVYWAVYPNSGYAYGELTRRAEQALDTRKRIRHIGLGQERGEKCTVCGIRAALTPQVEMPRKPLREEWKKLAQALHSRAENKRDPDYGGLAAALSGEGNERLCAICAGKRFAQRFYFEKQLGLKGGFPSTSSIATAAFRRDMLAKASHECMQFTQALADTKDKSGYSIPDTLSKNAFPPLSQAYPGHRLLEYDGDLFYPETYTAKRLQDDYGVEFDESALRKLQGAIRSLRDAASRAQVDLPPKYYAVMVMDGDHMGENLSKAQTVNEHRKISNGLRDFALQHVQAIVEDECLGRVVYAGGDDLMAFLPLEYVLDAARHLAQKFNQASGLTLSAGIAIAHHLAPLDGVLSAARAAEDRAKDEYGRNAVVFTVLKRSGEPLDVGAAWNDGPPDTLELVQELRDLFRGKKLSARFAYDAEREAWAISTDLKQAHQPMLARLFKRHGSDIPDQTANDLSKRLAQLGENAGQHILPAQTTPPLETARWLLLARFLAAAQAGEE